jgi:hypothetical protein
MTFYKRNLLLIFWYEGGRGEGRERRRGRREMEMEERGRWR